MSNIKKSPFSSSPWPCVNNNPKTLSFRANDDESAVIGALRSDRLFFDPGETRSILEEARHSDGVKITAIDSYDPFLDFRSSMAEMVEAHGLDSLDDLLTCYLRLNDRSNHGYIVAAYVDLLINHRHCSSSSSSAHYSFTSPLSFSSSSTVYSEHQIAAG
ncbi:transcription repressor OFP15-like [Salvia hispanica]|uniref:transcription repressor OFP15-like n=1 Tax=Salvia hispanica TaxID=49212 RepID=UPI00200960B8|nr:transcription repressor OFP15-like [Salvia hispanica]